MVDAPEELMELIKKAVAAHPDDVDDALEALLKTWARCPARKTWAEELEIRALRHMIHDLRHHQMVSMRRQYGAYGGEAKVSLSTGAAARVAEALLLDSYSIRGNTIGNILGDELDDLADAEHEQAEGSLFNERLCRKLKALVPAGKAVREVVSEKKLRKIFSDLGRRAAVEAKVA